MHDRASGNQAFFVGQRQTLAATQGFEGHGQTSKAHHGVDHHVGIRIGIAHYVGHVVSELHRSKLTSQGGAHRMVDNRDYSRAMSLDLFAQHGLVRPCGERNDFVSPARSGHHFERLSADRAGAAGYGNLDGHD